MQQTIDRPTPNTWPDATAQPSPTPGQAVDYLRRIHWWVRLVSIVFLTGVALSFLAGAWTAFELASTSTGTKDTTSNYSACVARGTSEEFCKTLYGGN